MGAAAPLTLRDFLEMACESSCSDGFRSYPRRVLPCPSSSDDGALATQAKLKEETAPVRLLIEADLRRSPSRTLSSILFPRSPRSLAAISRLSRTLSRRLVFWRRHPGEDDGSERDSLGLPSPVVSSCSASEHAESEAEAPGPPPVDAAEEKPASKPSPSPSPSSSSGSVDADDNPAAAGAKHKEQLTHGGDAVGSTEEEKQQLSPVSVMDFPFHHHHHDDDETSDAGTCYSPATPFQHCLPDDPERTLRSNKAQAQELLLLHKIRRLHGLAQPVGPVDLEAQFGTESDRQSAESDDTHTQTSNCNCSGTSADGGKAATWSPRCRSYTDREAEREPDEPSRLLARLLKDDDGTAVTSGATERLLLDFFEEGLDRRRSSEAGPVVGAVRPSDDESALVRAAQEWVQGAGTRWGAEDVLYAGEAALADMDRGRRWVRAGEEEREVGAALEVLVMDALVAELVRDLALAARR
ncbi:hypothetical protein CFC21_069060 [Triticum aestivum]|uniref:DUF4378 domain-containing protein n=2 Tax=Triticum aestivum TaxID=4565 RepID=A0A3B6KUE8_WHEAT|nr:uncharacterized protein LOC123105993 isoform X1 [Triticum aestivum]KAF7062460.1 hypothetical protein CFC21_069060 [Triticum aestivum]